MNKHSTTTGAYPELLKHLFELIQAHRGAFRQARPFARAWAMVIAEIISFGRHTITQSLLSLGLSETDWSAWYRLFSRPRYDEEEMARCLLRETLTAVPEEDLYVVGADGTQIPRSSRKMPGTGWLKAPRTPIFKTGIHRAQRFLHGAWLTPLVEGFSRAVPLRFLPAFTAKAVPAGVAAQKEWQAGVSFLGWVRAELDRVGRTKQWVLGLADGAFDRLGFWEGLPERVVAVVRTAKNRVLFSLPEAHPGPGRKALYGQRAFTPQEWLHQRIPFQTHEVQVRGYARQMRYTVQGPFVRESLPTHPLFLLVVKGSTRKLGQQRTKYKGPVYYLISAIQHAGVWQLPVPIDQILPWLWQRWELEVAHREMKSNLGLGEKQCWGPRSAVTSVQWGAWVYAILLLAGYRTWGILGGPRSVTRWWNGGKRWSFNTLWRSFRFALWGGGQFHPTWTGSATNWLDKETWILTLGNAVTGFARI